MNISCETDADGLNIRVEGSLTITDIGEAKAALSPFLSHQELFLDLSAIEKMDTAGLQLMLLLKKELGEHLHLVNHSDAVRRAIEFCNLTQAFGDPIVLPAHEG